MSGPLDIMASSLLETKEYTHSSLFSVQFGCVLQSAMCLDIHQKYPDLFFRKTKKRETA